jgi:signal transduction histidine kinase
LVLTVPLLGFLGVTGVQVSTSVRTADDLETLARQVAIGREIDILVHELQRERDRTVGALAALAGGSPVRDLSGVSPDRIAVDRAVMVFESAARSLTGDPNFARAYAQAQSGLAELRLIRDGAQAGWLRSAAVFDAYSRIVADLQAMLLVPATISANIGIDQAIRAYANASRAKELMAQIRGHLYAVSSAGRFAPGEFDIVTDVRARQQVAITQFRDDADPAAVAVWDEAMSGQAGRNLSRLEQTLVDNARAGSLGVDPQQWWQASTTQLERVRGAEKQLLDGAILVAEERSADERRSSGASTLLTLFLLLIALLASFAVGRIMVRTLQSLREQALDVAQRKLPEMIERLRSEPGVLPTMPVEPIAIQTADEVGEVAEAFTAVHRSAVRLAGEQALMRHSLNAIHVNLARRSQALVERQLRLLDELESAEVDPDQLASLFRLDHLATRMRRNDENLLVLAGGDSDRRWTEPIPLSTVVLAAAAEIEQYPRVRHDITDNVHIAGHAVADLVHLIAELVENATLFSPPDTAVTVLGWKSDEGGATVVISDEGIGMSGDALARANRQIAAPGSIDVAAAERMGLLVVGHLANRHRVRVRLRSDGPGKDGVSGSGVTVLVELPATLLAEPPAGQPSLAAAAALRQFASGELAGTGAAGSQSPRALPSGVLPVAAPRGAAAESTDTLDAGAPAGASPAAESSGIPATRGLTRAVFPTEGGAARRTKPTRAEDVLGLAHDEAESLWWSREPRTTGSTVPKPRRPVEATIATDAGLPRRVPMAQLPTSAGDQRRNPAGTVRTEADPDEVSSTLSKFYDGVHRAEAEDVDLQAAK